MIANQGNRKQKNTSSQILLKSRLPRSFSLSPNHQQLITNYPTCTSGRPETQSTTTTQCHSQPNPREETKMRRSSLRDNKGLGQHKPNNCATKSQSLPAVTRQAKLGHVTKLIVVPLYIRLFCVRGYTYLTRFKIATIAFIPSRAKDNERKVHYLIGLLLVDD